jgi:hypothetical protein
MAMAMAKGSADLLRRSGNSRKPSRQFRNSERRSSGANQIGIPACAGMK